jgi:hypothetical protein
MRTSGRSIVARIGAMSAATCMALVADGARGSEPFRLVIQPGSSLVVDNAIEAPSTGTLIGNYDATTNPSGTRTLPGLFGGSGNNAIPVSLDVAIGGQNQTSPAGAMTVLVNTGAGTFAIAALEIDLLNETPIETPISATVEYSTFRTASPSFIYPGGIPLTIPLGNASITVLSATLGSGLSEGALTPNGDGSYTMAGVATLDLSFQALVLDQPVDGGTVQIVAPIGGTFTPASDGESASLTLSLDVSNESEIPGPFPAVENVPFDLPTLDPNTPAKVLLTLAFERIDVRIGGAISATAQGLMLCRADFNADGTADILDFLDYIDGFSTCELNPAPCPTVRGDVDFTCDGLVDILDFLGFIDAFSVGCG